MLEKINAGWEGWRMILVLIMISFLISVNSEVKCNSTNISKKDHHIAQTQEEADMKIIVLVKHWRLNVFKNAVIKTIDTDATTFY